MAKDDYDIIAYKLLVYFYGCLKRTIAFNESVFRETVRKNVDNDEYFTDILFMMQEEGLIEGLAIINAWGGDKILANDISNAKITATGIHYLKENDRMHKVGAALKDAADIIATLAAGLL